MEQGAQNSLGDLEQASVLHQTKKQQKNWTKYSSFIGAHVSALFRLLKALLLFMAFAEMLPKIPSEFRLVYERSCTLTYAFGPPSAESRVEVCSLLFLPRAALCILAAIVFQKLLFSPI